MSSPAAASFTGYSVPPHCEPSSEFLALVSSTLHICIPNTLGLISSIFGCLSIISWLFAQLPQIYKNYNLQSTAGLSPFFLVEWCLGDSANLVGALFTRQASWQVIIASYYVFVDVVLVIQHYWYTWVKKIWKGKDGTSGSFDHDHGPIYEGIRIREEYPPTDNMKSGQKMRPSEPKDVGISKPLGNSPHFYSPSYSEKHENRRVRGNGSPSGSLPLGVSPKTILLTSMLCAVLANASPTPSIATISSSPTHSSLPSIFDAIKDPHSIDIETVGRILSWMSTVLYLGSRLPQLYKNYVRKSTSGLSPLLFIAAFCGNFFYSASLMTNPNAWYDYAPYGGGGWADADGNNRSEWVALATPFFLGAAGVLSLDAFMGVQFLIYGDQGEEPLVTVNDPEDPDHTHWRRVSGWMRGWIPSGEINKYLRSNSRSQFDEETRALLGNSANGGGNSVGREYGAV